MTEFRQGDHSHEYTEQRYWRRRANRRVRKARYARSLLRWAVILTTNAAIGSVLLYAAYHSVVRLAQRDEFAVQRIQLSGVTRASEAGIVESLQPLIGRSLLLLDLNEVNRIVRRDPWVGSALARRVLPATLHVSVQERAPSAIAVIGGLAHLIDRTGFVLGPCGPAMDDDLPVLTGLGGLQDGDLVRALRRGAERLERLRRATPAFAELISELDLSSPAKIVARTVDGGPRILLDPERIDRNVPQYVELRREIERRTGEVAYVDLRWTNRITVKPKNPISWNRER